MQVKIKRCFLVVFPLSLEPSSFIEGVVGRGAVTILIPDEG